jgi:hypothetical protein
MPPDTDVYSRPEWNQSERNKYVADLISQLHDLERKTNPKGGTQSAKGKNNAALEALRIASDLVNALAGWALDHQAGLALKDQKLQLSTAKTPEHRDSSNVRATDDDHRHEWYGRNWVGRLGGGPIDPIVARNWLMKLVRGLFSIFNLELMLMTLSALEACDYGEIQPMLGATKTGRKVNWTILQLQLKAIGFVKYREARGIKKFKALEEVAGAFGVSVHTLRTWETRLRNEFGQAEVAHQRAIAEEKGTSEPEPPYYGSKSLQTRARQYKMAVARKRAKQASP